MFEFYQQQIKVLLSQPSIEHIGSSAIPGAGSKGDSDILICVKEKEFDQTIQLLKGIKFQEKAHTLRTNDLCMLEAIDAQVDEALQLVTENSYFRNFMDFRDILRGQPRWVDAYNALTELSQDLDKDKYRKRKTQFIKRVLQQYLA